MTEPILGRESYKPSFLQLRENLIFRSRRSFAAVFAAP
jgi:hypothetical protein